METMEETKRKHYQELNEFRKRDPEGYKKAMNDWFEMMGEPTEETLERLKRIPKRSKANALQN